MAAERADGSRNTAMWRGVAPTIGRNNGMIDANAW
jgi:hypothetical protein